MVFAIPPISPSHPTNEDLFVGAPVARNGWGTGGIRSARANPFNNQARNQERNQARILARIQGRIRADLIRADLLICLVKCQRRGVDAIAQAGGMRAVGEDVAEMTAATSACDLNAPHAEAFVLMLHNGL